MNIDNVKQSVIFEDEEGNRLAQYQEVQGFENEPNLAKVRIGDNWAIINRNFEVVSRIAYEEIGEFMKELVVTKCKDGFTFINKDGEEICRPYDNVWDFSSKGVALVQERNDFFFINKDGERVGPRFDYISRYGRLGKSLSTPAMGSARDYFERGSKFQSYKGWINDMAIIFINGHQGIINKRGHLVTEVTYDEVCLDGVQKKSPYIPVSRNGKWGYIDKRTGKEVTLITYGPSVQWTELTPRTKLSKNGKLGFVDNHGFELTFFEFDRIGRFTNGFAIVRKGLVYGYLREDDLTLLSDVVFLSAYPFLDGFGEVVVKTIFGRKTRFIDKNGRLFKKISR